MGFLDYFITPKGLIEYDPEEFDTARRVDGSTVIDVRTHAEYAHGHIEGSLLVPLGSLKEKINSFEKNKTYLLVCATGHRSRAAAAMMLRNDFNKIAHLKGGMTAWRKNNKKVSK